MVSAPPSKIVGIFVAVLSLLIASMMVLTSIILIAPGAAKSPASIQNIYQHQSDFKALQAATDYYQSSISIGDARNQSSANNNHSTFASVGTYIATSYQCFRGYEIFDTSSIPDTATINNVTLKIYVTEKTATYHLVAQHNQSNVRPHYPLINSDYNKNYYSGSYSYASISAMTASAYNLIRLNATANTELINKTGLVRLTFRSDADIRGSGWISDRKLLVWSGPSTANQEPYLVVNWTVANWTFPFNPNPLVSAIRGIPYVYHSALGNFPGIHFSMVASGIAMPGLPAASAAWISLDTATGVVSGNPAPANANRSFAIRLTAIDAGNTVVGYQNYTLRCYWQAYASISGYEWPSDYPKYSAVETANSTYITYLGQDTPGSRTVEVMQYDGLNWLGPVTVAEVPDDNHVEAQIIINHTGYIHLFGGTHDNTQGLLTHWVSRYPYSINSWTAGDLIAPNNWTSYPIPIEYGNTTYLFYRDDSYPADPLAWPYLPTSSYGYRTSDDHMTTWSEYRPLVTADLCYPSVYAENLIYANSELAGGNVSIPFTFADYYLGYCANVYYVNFNLTDHHLRSASGADLGLRINETQANTTCMIYNSYAKACFVPQSLIDSTGDIWVFFSRSIGTDMEKSNISFVRFHAGSWGTVTTINGCRTTNYWIIPAVGLTIDGDIWLYTAIANTSRDVLGNRVLGGDIIEEEWDHSTGLWSSVGTIANRSWTQQSLTTYWPPIPVRGEGQQHRRILFFEVDIYDTEKTQVLVYGDTGFIINVTRPILPPISSPTVTPPTLPPTSIPTSWIIAIAGVSVVLVAVVILSRRSKRTNGKSPTSRHQE